MDLLNFHACIYVRAYVYLIVPEHEDILVGQEHLEGVDSFLSDEHSHLLPHLLTPPRHTNMEGVVAADLWVSPTAPSVVHLQQALVLWTKNKVNYKRRNRFNFLPAHTCTCTCM